MLKFASVGALALVSAIALSACSTPVGQAIDTAVGSVLGDINSAVTLVNADVASVNAWIAANSPSVTALCGDINVAETYYAAFNVKGLLTPNEQTAEGIAQQAATATCSQPITSVSTALSALAKDWAVIQAATTSTTLPTSAVSKATALVLPTPVATPAAAHHGR